MARRSPRLITPRRDGIARRCRRRSWAHWSTTAFTRIDRPIDGFRRVIRGFDPEHRGVTVGEFTVSIDAGCGFGGPLIAVCLDPTGDIVDVIEA